MTSTTDTVATATLEMLDPKALVIGANIRSPEHVDLNPEFLASVKDRGVLEPIIAWRDSEGKVIAKAGQRRILAAILAELATVPVWVHPSEPDTPDRIVDQWAENHHRLAMNLGDEAAAVEELTLFGVPADMIAQALNLDPETVTAARKVARSQTAKTYAAEGSVTLEYAALLAEFEDDAEVVETILTAAENEHPVEHLAKHLRNKRDEADVRARVSAKLAEKGITVVEDRYPTPAGQTRVGNLKANAEAEGPMTEDDHKDCPHRGAYVAIRSSWKHTQDPEAHPEKWEVGITHICLDWQAAGHVHDRPAMLNTGQPEKKKADDMTDEEREAAKADRRHVVASNKAWREATPVRREWLLKFGARKEPPTGSERFVAAHLVTWIGTSATHLSLVGLDQGKVTAELRKTALSPKRAAHLTTCVVVGSVEDHLHDDAWRTQLPIAGPYLEALGKWGYPLSDIEKRIIADAKTEAKAKK